MNNDGSRKVLQWKLDIEHHDATIEHVPDKANILADVFSRLVVRPQPVFIHHVLVMLTYNAISSNVSILTYTHSGGRNERRT